MEFVRIILSSVMALVVAMPMCVCGHVLLPEQDNQEHSCCAHHEEDKEPTDLGHDCELSHHAQLSFTSEESKTFDCQNVEIDPTPFISFKCEIGDSVSSNLLVLRSEDPEKLSEFYSKLFRIEFEYHRHGKGPFHY